MKCAIKQGLCLLFLLTACQKTPNISHFSGLAFDIPYHIQMASTFNEEQEEEILATIQDVFTHIHQVFNHWNPDSELSCFNHHPLNETFIISDDLARLLRLSLTIAQITEGRFDPTCGHFTRALKQGLEQTGLAGYHHLHLDGKRLSKTADIHLDLDGIVKGHAIDLLVQRLSPLCPNLFVEWGGEMFALGRHSKNRPWRVLVNQCPVDLFESAFATSGDALQRFPGNVTHIIDPATSKAIPYQGRSVSIQAPSCALADALATAMMLGDAIPDGLDNVHIFKNPTSESPKNVQK